mmetsp:Transcript_32141/g.68417  ORF Transcript_32141/g.68417 Transcript_32141/m.68417 type:complete len:671 (-) Transcript_32141:100-2112(-)
MRRRTPPLTSRNIVRRTTGRDDTSQNQIRATMTIYNAIETRQHRSSRNCRKRRRTPPSLRSALLAVALFLSPCLLLNAATMLLHGTSFVPSSGLRMTPLGATFQIFAVAEAKEIVATHEWQLLSENDTIPAGLHVRMDLSTGEKWAKLASDEEEGDEEIKAAAYDDDGSSSGGEKVEAVEMDAGGALSIVETSDASTGAGQDSGNNDDDGGTDGRTESAPLKRDYEMMHRVMSQLPPEELERFGGLPELASPNSTVPSGSPSLAQLTDEQRKLFERRMERIWKERQEELARLQQENVADLPSMLKGRIGTIQEHLEDVEGSLERISERRRSQTEEDDDDNAVNDVIDALRDLEFQLGDVDMARDFHTLGGWPHLVSLLDLRVHGDDAADDEEISTIADEVRALAAMTVGTAVGNLGEFRPWALEETSPAGDSALSLLVESFEEELEQRSLQMAGGSMAVLPKSSDARYKARAMYKLRAVYALGSLLRGNPAAQRAFVSRGGAEVLARDALGTLSNVRGPSVSKALTKLDYKFASKVLALGEDVVTDVVLHEDKYEMEGGSSTANRLVGAFATERWCDLSLRMLAPPSQAIGTAAGRGIKERALGAVRALAPACRELTNEEGNESSSSSWGLEEVKVVRSEWNREGSDDGLDPVYRMELLDLADGVLEALQ